MTSVRAAERVPSPDRAVAQDGTWERDLYRSALRSQRQAWVVAAVSSGLALLSLVALVLLLPLKEAVPYVVTKDPQTGYVEVARAVDATLSKDEALAEWSVVRYVTARETYDPDDLQRNYELVYASSSPGVWESYGPLYRRGRPGNLLDAYGRRVRVLVSIKSVSFLEPGRAFVRFATTRGGPSGEDTQHWAATLTFRYAASPQDLNERARNPLGFEVTSYRRDQEVVTERIPEP